MHVGGVIAGPRWMHRKAEEPPIPGYRRRRTWPSGAAPIANGTARRESARLEAAVGSEAPPGPARTRRTSVAAALPLADLRQTQREADRDDREPGDRQHRSDDRQA